MSLGFPAGSIKKIDVLAVSFWVFISVLLLYLAYAAFHLRVEYFDTYSVLINARGIGTHNPDDYYWKRYILLPVVLAPLFTLESWMGADGFAFVASHLAAVGFFAVLIRVFYRLLSLHLSRSTAIWGTFFLAINQLFIHYAPVARDDIPAVLFTCAAFYFYLRNLRKPRLRNYWLVALFTAGAMGMRYVLIPLLFPVYAIHEFAGGTARADTGKKILFYLVLPLLFFFSFHPVVYSFLGITSFFAAPARFLWELGQIHQSNVTQYPSYLNYMFLVRTCTWPVVLCGLWGWVAGIRRRGQGVLFHSIWLGFFFLFLTYAAQNRDARYLLILYPPFYFFVALGFESIRSFWAQKSGRYFPGLFGIACTVLIVFLPVQRAWHSAMKFQSPFYRADFEKRVSEYARGLAGAGHIFWFGPFYALHPKDYVFHPDDKATSIYHIYNHVIWFYAKKRVVAFDGPYQIAQNVSGAPIVFPGSGVGCVMNHGDALILNPEPDSYETKTVPAVLKPLLVQRVRKQHFRPAGKTPDGFWRFESERPGAGVLTGQLTEKGYLVEGTGVPDGVYELCVASPLLKLPVSFDRLIEVRGGAFSFLKEELTKEIPISSIALVSYDAVRAFYPTY